MLPCSDYRLQLVYMKVESQVIVDQHATVKIYLDPVHTARHMPEVYSAWSLNFNIFDSFYFITRVIRFYMF